MSTQQKTSPEPVRVIGCGMIAREILAVCEKLQLHHVSLKCLPADWHHHPQHIAPAVEKAVLEARADGFENIFIAYGDCGTGGALDAVCEKLQVERIAGPHCFSFYMGNEKFANSEDRYLTSFFMTDFLARHFKNFLLKPLGLDRHPELRDEYFGNYDSLVYLAQTKNAELEAKAQEAAEILQLKYIHQPTDYGDLETHLQKFSRARLA